MIDPLNDWQFSPQLLAWIPLPDDCSQTPGPNSPVSPGVTLEMSKSISKYAQCPVLVLMLSF